VEGSILKGYTVCSSSRGFLLGACELDEPFSFRERSQPHGHCTVMVQHLQVLGCGVTVMHCKLVKTCEKVAYLDAFWACISKISKIGCLQSEGYAE
jgi:hypothetical protein